MKAISNHKFPVMLGFATILLSPANASADALTDAEKDVQELEAVQVKESRKSQRKDLEIDSLTNPFRVEESSQVGVEVFTSEDIAKLMPKDINDLLDKSVGLNVNYQGRRSPFQLTERGGGTFTYILNGAVLPPSNNRILYAIPLSAVEQISVVRGATTLTLGPSIPIGSSSSGTGMNTAYVIINTKQPEGTELDLAYSVEKGTEGHPVSQTESLYAGTVLDLHPGLKNYVGGMVSYMDKPSQDTWFDGQRYASAMGTMGFKTEKFTLNLMAMQNRSRFEMQRGVTIDGTLDTAKWYYDPLTTTVCTGDMTMEWTPEQVTLFNVFGTRYQQTEHNENFATTTSSMRHYEEKTSGLGLRHNARFGGTLIQVGAQASKCTGFGANTNQPYNNYDTTVEGGAVSVQQDLFNKRLILDAGYRQDIKHIDYSATSASRLDANSDVDMAPAEIYATGAHWAITKMFDFDGRYLHGHEGLAGDFDMRTQSGTLHPGSQERVELTLTAKPAGFIKPAITWFNVDMKNAKTATTTTYETETGTYYYYTESDELRRGVELLVSGDVKDWGTSYKLGWTYMLTADSTSSSGVTTDAIGLSIPENLFTAMISQKWKDYTATISVKTMDDWTDTSSAMGYATTGGLGGFTRVDFNIQKDFHLQGHRVNAALYFRNLTNEQYATRYVTGYYYDRGCVIGTQVTLEF